jgi:5-methyltetrahydropteroyltriglutamate--homocysteine methyltransferase
MQVVPPEQLVINPDCGFWETPRWIAFRKLRAMVEGTKIVRRELEGK